MLVKSLRPKGLSYGQIKRIQAMLEDPFIEGHNSWMKLQGKEKPDARPQEFSRFLGTRSDRFYYPRFRSPAPHRIAHTIVAALSTDGASFDQIMRLTHRSLSQASLESHVPRWAFEAYVEGCVQDQNAAVGEVEHHLNRLRAQGHVTPEAEQAARAEIANQKRAKAPLSEAAFRKLCVETGVGSFDTRSQVHYLRDCFGQRARDRMWQRDELDPDLQIRDDQCASYVSTLLHDIGVPQCAEHYHVEMDDEQKAALKNDPTFHPGELARRWEGDPAYKDAMAPRESEWVDEYDRGMQEEKRIGEGWAALHRSIEKRIDAVNAPQDAETGALQARRSDAVAQQLKYERSAAERSVDKHLAARGHYDPATRTGNG